MKAEKKGDTAGWNDAIKNVLGALTPASSPSGKAEQTAAAEPEKKGAAQSSPAASEVETSKEVIKTASSVPVEAVPKAPAFGGSVEVQQTSESKEEEGAAEPPEEDDDEEEATLRSKISGKEPDPTEIQLKVESVVRGAENELRGTIPSC